MGEWWESFFDADYIRLWDESGVFDTAKEVEGLWTLLGLGEGSRILDAPCGYGRIARSLAENGASVLGVDQSAALIEHAERTRGGVPAVRLRYRRHDLRRPLDEDGFDCALNIFTSLGYGTEQDDLAILRTLRAAVRPGGKVFVETAHRDLAVSILARQSHPSRRLADGTEIAEERRFDAISGRMETRWRWSGPAGEGEKSASLRIYAATELVALVERAGLRMRSAHHGCSPEPFRTEGPDLGGRLGLLAERPA